jgi:hypothetical protein
MEAIKSPSAAGGILLQMKSLVIRAKRRFPSGMTNKDRMTNKASYA